MVDFMQTHLTRFFCDFHKACEATLKYTELEQLERCVLRYPPLPHDYPY